MWMPSWTPGTTPQTLRSDCTSTTLLLPLEQLPWMPPAMGMRATPLLASSRMLHRI